MKTPVKVPLVWLSEAMAPITYNSLHKKNRINIKYEIITGWFAVG